MALLKLKGRLRKSRLDQNHSIIYTNLSFHKFRNSFEIHVLWSCGEVLSKKKHLLTKVLFHKENKPDRFFWEFDHQVSSSWRRLPVVSALPWQPGYLHLIFWRSSNLKVRQHRELMSVSFLMIALLCRKPVIGKKITYHKAHVFEYRISI